MPEYSLPRKCNRTKALRKKKEEIKQNEKSQSRVGWEAEHNGVEHKTPNSTTSGRKKKETTDFPTVQICYLNYFEVYTDTESKRIWIFEENEAVSCCTFQCPEHWFRKFIFKRHLGIWDQILNDMWVWNSDWNHQQWREREERQTVGYSDPSALSKTGESKRAWKLCFLDPIPDWWGQGIFKMSVVHW